VGPRPPHDYHQPGVHSTRGGTNELRRMRHKLALVHCDPQNSTSEDFPTTAAKAEDDHGPAFVLCNSGQIFDQLTPQNAHGICPWLLLELTIKRLGKLPLPPNRGVAVRPRDSCPRRSPALLPERDRSRSAHSNIIVTRLSSGLIFLAPSSPILLPTPPDIPRVRAEVY
jgi:hypothetical protein